MKPKSSPLLGTCELKLLSLVDQLNFSMFQGIILMLQSIEESIVGKNMTYDNGRWSTKPPFLEPKLKD